MEKPFLENLDIILYQNSALDWIHAHIMNIGFAYQTILIIMAFLVSIGLNRLMKPPMTEIINKLHLPYKLTEILNNMVRILMPLMAMIFIFIGTHLINGLEIIKSPTFFAEAMAKLLLAWIIIHLFAQIIEQKFSRTVITSTVLGLIALSIFGILDETTIILDSLGFNLGQFRFSALTVAKGVLGLFILMYVALFLANVTDKKLSSVRSLNPSSRVLFSKFARIFYIVTAILIGITAAGIDLSLFAIFSGAIGLGVGFGLQKVISNLFSGMLLLMDQSIKPGDIIEMDGTFGWVNHMGARYTEVVTRDNKSYIIPNELFITQQVINWSHGNTLVRIETSFRVHYDSDPHIVKKLAVEAATKVARVVDSPVPMCHLTKFGDSSLEFVLRYWIKDAEKGVVNTRGDVLLALWDIFKENGVKIPYPQHEVYIHQKTEN